MIDTHTEAADRLNGRVPDIVNAALELHAGGFDVVRVQPRSKKPYGEGWQDKRYPDETAIVEEFEPGDNLGRLLGGGDADVDLDCAEARRIATTILPATDMIHGRETSPASHYAYSYPKDAPLRTRRYKDPRNNDTLLELRADKAGGGRGLQTVMPPSIHGETGEMLRYEMDGDPGGVDPEELITACNDLAAAVLLIRAWPATGGSRHDLALALGGMFARGGLPEERAWRIAEGAFRHGGADPEHRDRFIAIRDSYEAIERGESVTGAPTVARILGDDVTRLLREWLHLGRVDAEDRGEEGEERTPRFVLLSDSEIERREPPDMLVDGVVPAGSLGILWGAPGSLKTFAALDIALHVQTGRDWCGRTTQRGNLLFVAAEGGGHFGRRPAAWKAWHKVEGDTGAKWLLDAPQLRDAADVRALVRAIQDATSDPLALVVLDTLARCAVGVEENSATDTGLLIAGCDAIRRATGAAVLLVHHPGKDGLRERGSSALRGAADVMISASVDGDVLTLRCDKVKDFEPFPDFYLGKKVIEFPSGATTLILEPTTRDAAAARPAGVDRLTGNARVAYEALVVHFGEMGATSTEWRAVADLKERSFFAAMKALRAWGFVRSEKRRNYPV